MTRLFFLLLCSASLFAQTPEAAVRAAEKNFAAALVSANAPALEKLLSPDLSYGHASGKLDTKQTYIARIRSGAQKYVAFHYDPQPPTVHLYGHTAVLIASAQVESITDGQPNTLHLRFLHVWVLQNGAWSLSAHQSVRLQPPTQN